MLDENAEAWMLEKYPNTDKTNYNLSFDAEPYASAGKLYVKAFTGTDEWAGKIITDMLPANIDMIHLLLAERCSTYMLSHTTQMTFHQTF